MQSYKKKSTMWLNALNRLFKNSKVQPVPIAKPKIAKDLLFNY